MANMKNSTLCVLGCGNLGSAILKSLIDRPQDQKAAVLFTRFIASVRSQESKHRLTAQFSAYSQNLSISRDSLNAVQESDIVVLAVDPAVVETVLLTAGLRDALADKLLISVAAGWTRQKLETTLYGSPTTSENTKGRTWVVRTLPNIAASVSQSLTAIEISEPELPD
ncbi:delta 1-pyrroline-5-carboxylate reductase [Aspergillus alliaceus]|uniref:Delta 1-pyrroline-5-carboxylate reductase n=1 Tax=Petromyces alliaceus TaxID=209559 RepID=A0A8H6E2M6_PETAA|nr:delta 1-pyrroline-5-carboxylate reductase [Aspergillus burnettii]